LLTTEQVTKVPNRLYELEPVSPSVIAAIPPRVLAAINNYVWYAQPTGDFVSAVLSNDLLRAVGRADERSLNAIKAICVYIHNAVPSVCYGNKEAVLNHLRKQGIVEGEHNA